MAFDAQAIRSRFEQRGQELRAKAEGIAGKLREKFGVGGGQDSGGAEAPTTGTGTGLRSSFANPAQKSLSELGASSPMLAQPSGAPPLDPSAGGTTDPAAAPAAPASAPDLATTNPHAAQLLQSGGPDLATTNPHAAQLLQGMGGMPQVDPGPGAAMVAQITAEVMARISGAGSATGSGADSDSQQPQDPQLAADPALQQEPALDPAAVDQAAMAEQVRMGRSGVRG